MIKPVIRLREVYLENFKSIRHGDFLINSDMVNAVLENCSDVIGVYGQNGSGKTALIDALGILKRVLMGESLREDTLKYISLGADYAFFSFTFDFFSNPPLEYAQTVTYSFKIREMIGALSEGEKQNESMIFGATSFAMYQTEVYDETVSVSGHVGEEELKKQPIITTVKASDFPFGPVRKIADFVGNKKNTTREALKLSADDARRHSRSFIFSSYSLRLFERYRPDSEYVRILLAMQEYARKHFFVINREKLNALPIYTQEQNFFIRVTGPTELDEKRKRAFDSTLEAINTVLPVIIPGMTIVAKDARVYDDDERTLVNLFSRRDGKDILLDFESEGIQRIISILSLLIQTFVDNSTLVAIDELDAGIFEYLLGDLLAAFEKYGRGQLVFTSHNLRPLEVLKKEHIVFTTTNPDNRYIRMKGVGKSNNLRDMYLREILNCNQDEDLYDPFKQFTLVASIHKASIFEHMSKIDIWNDEVKTSKEKKSGPKVKADAREEELYGVASDLESLTKHIYRLKAGVERNEKGKREKKEG